MPERQRPAGFGASRPAGCAGWMGATRSIGWRLLAARLGRVPYLDGQRAVAVRPLTRGWRLADDEAVNRHRVRRQPDRRRVQAEPADHLHARAVEQPRDIRHYHPGMPIRIRLQRFLTPSTSYHVIALITGHR